MIHHLKSGPKIKLNPHRAFTCIGLHQDSIIQTCHIGTNLFVRVVLLSIFIYICVGMEALKLG